jgi:ketosteroid isomerase-like protein
MSRHVDLVRQAYAAFGRGDVQGVLDCMTDDIEWEPIYGAASYVPTAGHRHGKAQVAEFFRTLYETEQFDSFEPREFIEQGDVVIVLGHYAGRTKPAGRRMESDWVMIFRMRGGKVASFKEFTNSAALNAAWAPAAAAAV